MLLLDVCRCSPTAAGLQSYGKPVDMWAVGCMLAEMKTGMPLFPGDSDIDQLFKIMATFGTLTPRMLQLVRNNPLFVGVTVRCVALRPRHIFVRCGPLSAVCTQRTVPGVSAPDSRHH